MRRTFRILLHVCVALLLLLAVAFPAPAQQQPARRPNILFCFADDFGRYASAYAKADGPGTLSDAIKTPHIDRVASEGVLFRHAFVSAPSCTPCRSALLSGQYFFRTGRGAILRGAIWDETIPTFPLLLHEAGYHIGESYKVWSPGTPVDAPYGGGKFGYERAGGRFNNFSENMTQMVRGGTPLAKARQTLLDEVKANFADFLAAREADTPFCYWFGPTNVHRKWIRGSGKALWGINPDDLKGKVPPFLPDVPEIREDLADYLGEIQAFDAAIGVHLAELARVGELDNTLVVVSGDHGAPGFTHGKCNLYDFGTGVSLAIRGPGIPGGRVLDEFVLLPDLAPTFLEAGGVKPPGVMTGKSLIPVLKSDQQGQVDPARTWVITGRERHVENANEGNLPYPQRALRTAGYLYIVNFAPDRWPMGNPVNLDGPNPPDAVALTEDTRVTLRDMDSSPTKAWLVAHRNDSEGKRYYDLAFARRPREELYDLKSDPHQVTNVAADVKYAKVRGELEQRLMAELRRAGDPRVTGDGLFFEKPPLAGPLDEESQPAKKKKAKQ